MIIYEVNLSIEKEIVNEYYTWLTNHVGEMLKFVGFKKAEILEEVLDSTSASHSKNLTVRYHLERAEDLDNYLLNHSTTMREDAIKRFGNKFSAYRRIFSVKHTL